MRGNSQRRRAPTLMEDEAEVRKANGSIPEELLNCFFYSFENDYHKYLKNNINLLRYNI